MAPHRKRGVYGAITWERIAVNEGRTVSRPWGTDLGGDTRLVDSLLPFVDGRDGRARNGMIGFDQ